MKKNAHSKSDSSANQKVIDSYDFMSNAASSQDCTGLIPAGPVDEEELIEVFHFSETDVKVCLAYADKDKEVE